MPAKAHALFNELALTRGMPPVVGGAIVHELIGYGGMGAIFRAAHPGLGVPVVVKILYRTNELDVRQRFLSEAQLARKIRHPNVARVYESDRDGDVLYVIQEYVEGQSAESLLIESVARQTPLDEALALKLAADAARGLTALHAANFLHLDIKPANLMISARDGVCKLLDLGMAKRYDDRPSAAGSANWDREKFAGGTPGYASPEQLQFLRVGPTSDIYSLGVTLYDLLAGRRINTAASSWGAALREQTTRAIPDIRTLRSEISAPTAALLERCVRIEPAERFQSATELLDALRIV
jgi:serine/threonine-protein kinase